jgi:hypothetical protein
MAGKTIEDAHEAQQAAQGKATNGNTQTTVMMSTHIMATSTNHQAVSTTLVPTAPSHGTPLIINGKKYFPEPDHTDTALVTNYSVDLSSGDLFEYKVFTAFHDDLRMPVDWETCTQFLDTSGDTLPIVYTATSSTDHHAPAQDVQAIPFILDTGATCHISPQRSDFKTLCTTPPHPVKSIGNSCVYATGMGTVELTITSGHKVTLNNVLFIPNSSVQLLSMLTFNHSGNFVSHFDLHQCWVMKKDNTIILQGNVIENK